MVVSLGMQGASLLAGVEHLLLMQSDNGALLTFLVSASSHVRGFESYR